MAEHRAGTVLRVDPIACEGVGICAHLAPDLVVVDRWGYPMVNAEALTEKLARQARTAVHACPHRALFMD
jgi:ferredoxin